jgi:hypothetical protein
VPPQSDAVDAIGLIFRGNLSDRGKDIIVVSPLRVTGRQNSDLAHELAHILINHGQAAPLHLGLAGYVAPTAASVRVSTRHAAPKVGILRTLGQGDGARQADSRAMSSPSIGSTSLMMRSALSAARSGSSVTPSAMPSV